MADELVDDEGNLTLMPEDDGPAPTAQAVTRPMRLGLCLRAYRHKHDLNAAELAAAIGIAPATLSRLERDTMFGLSLPVWRKIQDWLLACDA